MKFSFFFFLFIFLIALTSAAVNIGEENTLSRGVNIVAPSVVIIDTNATTGCSGSQVLFGNGSCGTIAGSGGIGDFSFTDFQASYDLNLTNIFNQDLNTTSNVNFGNVTILNNLSVDGNTFFVDNVNNRVGIGTITPGAKLAVVGSIIILVDENIGTNADMDLLELKDSVLQLNGKLRFNTTNGEYQIGQALSGSTEQSFIIKSRNAGESGLLSLFSMDGDSTDNVTLRVYGLGTSDDITTASERIELGYDTTQDEFKLAVSNIGTGNAKDMNIYTPGNRNQLFLDTNGNVGIGTASPSEQLHVQVGSGAAADFKLENSEGSALIRSDAGTIV
ncbi:hypothetical protein LCGC14_1509100, partial [marine sediment metagenome]